MWDFLVAGTYSAYVELVLLVVLLGYFFLHWRDPRQRASGISLVRVVLIVLVFLYLLLNWSSNIQPGLRLLSVLGMLLINLHLLLLVIQSRLERPYRETLAAFCRQPRNQELLNRLWRSGKRFYYMRFLFQSFLSGSSPLKFLHEMANGRILDDIQSQVKACGEDRQFISLAGIGDFLRGRLAQDRDLPGAFKEMMEKAVEEFVKHPWIEGQVNEYLRTAVENPENIYNPDWSTMWEQATQPGGK
ncbi:MAG: hypothetical protein FJ128_01385 [Deltaproteobacteria bacterium]|nr:hypothetical protein [Deltaproteobacteria bacterium]